MGDMTSVRQGLSGRTEDQAVEGFPMHVAAVVARMRSNVQSPAGPCFGGEDRGMFIDTVSEESAAGALAEFYQQQKNAWGFLPNFAQAFSTRPDVAKAYHEPKWRLSGFRAVIERARLPADDYTVGVLIADDAGQYLMTENQLLLAPGKPEKAVHVVAP